MGRTSYERITDIARSVGSGAATISRLTPEAERGRIEGGRRNVEASLILGTIRGANEQKYGADNYKGIATAEEEILEEYARQEGVWLFDLQKHPNIRGGQEATIYRDKKPEYILKAYDYKVLAEKPTPLQFLDDRISLFNYLFSSTRYELVGFDKDTNGNFRFIVRQRKIEGRIISRFDAFPKYMGDTGFANQIGHTFWNRFYIIGDLHNQNVLRGKDGNFYIIDAVTRLNTPDDFEGVLHYKPFEIAGIEKEPGNG